MYRNSNLINNTYGNCVGAIIEYLNLRYIMIIPKYNIIHMYYYYVVIGMNSVTHQQKYFVMSVIAYIDAMLLYSCMFFIIELPV